MTRTRGLLSLIAIGALGAWLAWASLAPIRRPPDHLVATAGTSHSPADRAGFELDGRAERLRARVASLPAPRPVARNPFRFAVRETPTSAVRRSAPALTVPASVQPDAASLPPPLRLVGVLERATPTGQERLAVLATRRELFVAGAGERFGGRYTVVSVDAAFAEIEDTVDGRTIRLTLAAR